MNIRIIHEQDYEESLLFSGYNNEQLDQAEHLVSDEFERCATYIYHELMDEQCPENIELRLKHDADGIEGFTKEGAFVVYDSTSTNLVFLIYDSSIIEVIENGMAKLHELLMHELIHALDYEELMKNYKLMHKLDNKVKDYFCQQDYDSLMCIKPYYDTLMLLAQYRNEGIAIMLSSLLNGNPLARTFLTKPTLRFFRGLQVESSCRPIRPSNQGFSCQLMNMPPMCC